MFIVEKQKQKQNDTKNKQTIILKNGIAKLMKS